MPAADWLWHGCHDCMDIWWIRRLFGHWADLCFRWFGTVGWLVGLGRLRLPVRLSSRVQTLLSQHNQCLFPPLLTCLKEQMSMNTLCPGLVCNFFIFFFGMFLCLILACAQTSHGANFPVNLILM